MIGQTPSLSFEIFPPKPEVGNEKIIQTLDEMQGLAPHFISVTCSNNPESLRAAGLAYAVDQIIDLVTNDVAGVHLYTMNNAETARTIHQATHSLFKHYS